MSYVEKCEVKGCENEATRISSTETKYIMICDDCWHEKYKNQHDSKTNRYGLEGGREGICPPRRYI